MRNSTPRSREVMGFTKLDSGIVDSSIWDEPSDVLKVFQTFWTKSNSKGSVRATHESLFRTANLRDMSGNPLSLEWFDGSGRARIRG